MSTKNLPEDVIVEILLVLRVKSLVRFRCVSKRWRSLIYNPRFAKSHFKRASEHTQRLLLSSPSEIRSLEFDAPFGNSSVLEQLDHRISILGSCNGLVCLSLYDYKDFYIWNPSTGDYSKLPDPWISPNEDTYKHGFGYDLSTDDYKLLVATCCDGYFVPEVQVEVFSLKSNSWKRIEDQEPGYSMELVLSFDCHKSPGTLFNGALHWKAEFFDPDYFDKIIAFDLAEEKFREVPIPMDDDDDEEEDYEEERHFDTLSNLQGRLCFTCYRPTHIELWGMMEYGVQESWAPMSRVTRLDNEYGLTPLCFSRRDQFVALHNQKELIRSNPEGEILERFMVFGHQAWCEAAVFVESLLSPNDYDGDD